MVCKSQIQYGQTVNICRRKAVWNSTMDSNGVQALKTTFRNIVSSWIMCKSTEPCKLRQFCLVAVSSKFMLSLQENEIWDQYGYESKF